MKVAYGIRREDDSLVVVGSVKYHKPNGVAVTFNDQGMRLGLELRAFLLLAPASLGSWSNAGIPDLSAVEPQAKLWANPAGKRPDHRPQTFKGYPISPNIVLLVPMVTDLTKFDREHSGFIEAYATTDVPRCPRCGKGELRDSTERERGICALCINGIELSKALDAKPLPPGTKTMSLVDALVDDGYPRDVARRMVSDVPLGSPWGVQVQWIRQQLEQGANEDEIADRIRLPLESIEAAKTWVDPDEKKPKRQARSLDDL